jgi:hypothetical protein
VLEADDRQDDKDKDAKDEDDKNKDDENQQDDYIPISAWGHWMVT